MATDDPRRIVRNSYDRLGQAYTAWARDVRVSERARYLQYVLDTVPAGGRILDLGCEENRRLVHDAGLTIEHDALETDEFGSPSTFHWVAARKR